MVDARMFSLKDFSRVVGLNPDEFQHWYATTGLRITAAKMSECNKMVQMLGGGIGTDLPTRSCDWGGTSIHSVVTAQSLSTTYSRSCVRT